MATSFSAIRCARQVQASSPSLRMLTTGYEALAVMGEWYNGYRFAPGAANDLYNTDMVLYYVKASIPIDEPPRDLIDTNVRIDYGKLRHLLTVNRQLNGNYDLLRHLIGEGWVDSEISSGFPLEHVDQREHFLSLLHYFGLLSIREVREDTLRRAIPNQTVRRLMYGYLRDGYRDMGVFSVDLYAFSRLLHEMAYRGAWRPVLEFLERRDRRARPASATTSTVRRSSRGFLPPTLIPGT